MQALSFSLNNFVAWTALLLNTTKNVASSSFTREIFWKTVLTLLSHSNSIKLDVLGYDCASYRRTKTERKQLMFNLFLFGVCLFKCCSIKRNLMQSSPKHNRLYFSPFHSTPRVFVTLLERDVSEQNGHFAHKFVHRDLRREIAALWDFAKTSIPFIPFSLLNAWKL